MGAYATLRAAIGTAVDGISGLAYDAVFTDLSEIPHARDGQCIVTMDAGTDGGLVPGGDDIGYTDHEVTVQCLVLRNPTDGPASIDVSLDRVNAIKGALNQLGVTTTANAMPPRYTGYTIDRGFSAEFLAVVVEFTVFQADSNDP